MRDLFVDRILYGWERAQALPAGMRPLALLAAASGEASERELLQLPLGERDRRLLELRARLFGERLVGLALCRHCGEHLEVDLALSDVRVNAPTLENAGCIESSGFVVHVRLPNGSDLAALTASDDIASARRAIFERCVLEASRAGAAFPVRDLPDTVVERVAEWMESADSQANIELTVHCPACGNAAPRCSTSPRSCGVKSRRNPCGCFATSMNLRTPTAGPRRRSSP